ncbi:degenerin unc-8-like [Ptychodera flava]|uniref:degenerin unc-8-like n=1 Tax=Ptychodera flava TaxID=63121 RepID=UPI003969E85F
MQDLSTGNGAISENLLRIDVYYQELNFETIYAEAAYVWSDLGSDFGGLIGLWIGVSILTCFEFIEFLIDLASLAIARGCARPKKSKPRDPKFSDHSKDVFYLERRQQVSGTASPYWSNAIERYDSHYNQRHRAENRVMPYKQPFQQGTGRGDQSYSYY